MIEHKVKESQEQILVQGNVVQIFDITNITK